MIRAISLVGPTAAGKTVAGIAVALALGGEIVSIDSRQIYRDLEIGTAKPAAAELAAVPHHLISRIPPDETVTAATYARLAAGAIRDIAARGRVPILVGGAGLYFRVIRDGLSPLSPRIDTLRERLAAIVARGGLPRLTRLLARLDPARAARILPNDAFRTVRALEVILASGRTVTELYAAPKERFIDLNLRVFCLTLERPALYERIDRRVEAMIRAGLVDEVRGLCERYTGPAFRALMNTLGYREALAHLDGALTLPACVALIKQNTRRFAKRQLTWFRKDRDLTWLNAADPGAADRIIVSGREFLDA